MFSLSFFSLFALYTGITEVLGASSLGKKLGGMRICGTNVEIRRRAFRAAVKCAPLAIVFLIAAAGMLSWSWGLPATWYVRLFDLASQSFMWGILATFIICVPFYSRTHQSLSDVLAGTNVFVMRMKPQQRGFEAILLPRPDTNSTQEVGRVSAMESGPHGDSTAP